MPRTTLPAAALGESCPAGPPSVNSGGLRKAWTRAMSLLLLSAFVRATVSVSIECPNR